MVVRFAWLLVGLWDITVSASMACVIFHINICYFFIFALYICFLIVYFI